MKIGENLSFREYCQFRIKNDMERVSKHQILTDRQGFPLTIIDYSCDNLFKGWGEMRTELYEKKFDIPGGKFENQSQETTNELY